MKRLTRREEAVMELFWEHGAMFVKDLMEYYPDPKPHINTLSSHVRSLEAKCPLAQTFNHFNKTSLLNLHCI